MNFTDEQFEALAPFEPYFRTITTARYASYVGFRNAERIWKILKEAGLHNGSKPNFACGQCVSRLIKQAAVPWFADKDARIAAKNESEAVEATLAVLESTPKAEADPKPKKTSSPKKSTKTKKES